MKVIPDCVVYTKLDIYIFIADTGNRNVTKVCCLFT